MLWTGLTFGYLLVAFGFFWQWKERRERRNQRR